MPASLSVAWGCSSAAALSFREGEYSGNKERAARSLLTALLWYTATLFADTVVGGERVAVVHAKPWILVKAVGQVGDADDVVIARDDR